MMLEIRHCLSGNPKSTPKLGYTNRVTPPFEIWSNAAISLSLKWIILMFSSILEGVTDFASTELPRATVQRQRSCSRNAS